MHRLLIVFANDKPSQTIVYIPSENIKDNLKLALKPSAPCSSNRTRHQNVTHFKVQDKKVFTKGISVRNGEQSPPSGVNRGVLVIRNTRSHQELVLGTFNSICDVDVIYILY